MRKKLFRHLLPLVIITVLSVVVTLPLLRQPDSALMEDLDGALITWIMTWSARSLTEHPSQLYNTPILYPLPLTYTFSDPMISGAILGLPFWLMTKEPVIFSTVNYVLAVWLTGTGSYLLLKDLTNSRGSALAGALLIGFTSLHFTYYIHLHTFMIQGIPVGLWAWWRFSRSQHRRWLALWAGSLLFQTLNSPLTGYLFLAAHGLYLFDRTSWKMIQKHWRWCLGTILGCGIIMLFVYYPYIQSAAIYSSTRTIRDAAHFGLSLNSWWQNGGVWQLTILGSIVLAVLGLFSQRHNAPLRKSPLLQGTLFTAVIAFLMALGPVLKWSGQTVSIPFAIPLPYAVAYYAVPGMNAFRTPDRWLLLSGILVVIFITIIWRKKPALLLTFAIVLIVLEQQWHRQPVSFASRIDRPTVYSWLDSNKIDTALFIPTYVYDSPGGSVRHETHRMLWLMSNDHVTQLHNGYTGFAPQATMNGLKEYNEQFPNPKFWERVVSEEIEVVVVELNQLTDEQRTALMTVSQKPTYTDESVMIFKLR